MCYGCWEGEGKPAIVNDVTKLAARLIDRLYGLNCVGGNLHIVTDDWNINDSNLAYCQSTIDRVLDGKPGAFDDVNPEQVAIEAKILRLMKPMTEAQRASTLALQSGFINDEGREIDYPPSYF